MHGVVRAFITVCLCFTAMQLPGQEPDASQPPRPAPPAMPETVRAAWEKLVYIPYRNLKSVYDREGSSVILPYLEYLKLWQQSQRQADAALPVDALITEAEYVGAVEKDLVRVTARFSIQSLKAGWSRIPLQFGDAAVGKLTSENNRILLQGTGDGTYELLIPEAGTWTVELELATRILTSPDGRSFEFGCPTVGITTFELSIPDSEQTVTISPRLVALPVAAGDGETRIKASLGATRRIAANWSPRSSERPEMELLASVQNLLQVHLSEGLIHRDARLTYSVLRGEMDQIRIVVPVEDRVLDVSALNTRVKGWRSVKEAGQQIITVELLSPVRNQLVIEVHTEKTLGMEEALPTAGRVDDKTCFGIHALDVVRESGQLVVSHSDELAVTYDPPVGLTRINAEEVDEKARRTNAVYYRFYSARFELLVTARPVEPRLTATQLASFTIEDEQLSVQSQWMISVERAGVFAFQWKIPEGLTIRSVITEGLANFRIDEAQGLLIATLSEKVQGNRQVVIRGVLETDATSGDDLELPLLELEGAERESGTISLFAPPSIEVNTQPDQLIGVQPAPPANQTVRGSARLVAAWTYGKRPASVTIRAMRKATRLTARVGSRIEIAEELASVRTRVEFTIEHAGLDRLQISVPESISDDVVIELAAGAAIKEKIPAESAVDGWVTWTLVLQEEVIGVQAFDVTYDLPEPEADADQRSFTVETIQVVAVEQEDAEAIPVSQLNGEIEVARNRALTLKMQSTGGDVEPIDIRELSLPMPALRGGSDLIVTSAYRYHEQPVTVTLESQKHEIQEVVETVIPRALIEVVIGRDPLASYRCRYRIISSERQRLRIDLPLGVELIEPRLDEAKIALEKADASITPEDGWESYFVNVSRSKTSDEPFYLTIQFRARISAPDQPPFSGQWGGIQLIRLPRIGSDEGGDVAMQEVRVAAWVPERFSLVGQPDRFVIQSSRTWLQRVLGRRNDIANDGQLDQWIGFSAPGLIDFPTEGHGYVYDNLGGAALMEIRWWEDLYLVWVLSGTLVLVGWIIRRTTWENKLGLLLFIGFAAAMYSFEDSDIVIQGLRAARYGLVAMLVYWILHGILSPSHRLAAAPRQVKLPPPSYTAAAVIPPPGIFELEQQQMERRASPED